MPDLGSIPGWLGAAGIGVAIYFLKSIHGDLRALTASFHTFQAEVPGEYARKSDLTEMRAECAADHRRIHTRIDDIHASEWAARTSGD